MAIPAFLRAGLALAKGQTPTQLLTHSQAASVVEEQQVREIKQDEKARGSRYR